ncbi:MAG: hypothetical protein V1897_05590 [Pseudomonadota bacterium]
MKRSEEIKRLKDLYIQHLSYYLGKQTETVELIIKLNIELKEIVYGSKPDEDVEIP